MKAKIEELKKKFEGEIEKIKSSEKLEELRLAFLGKKGEISALMADFKNVANEQKRELGALINNFKDKVENSISAKKQELSELEDKIKMASDKKIDFTLPAQTGTGSLHPRTLILKEVEDVFVSMGFTVEDGFEVETEYDNFDAVNVPANHPARDMQDTFWLDNGQLLKTHTSAAQNR
ncbi:MAG: phenylalanine--tRNA ligase subunit alpha, partial [Clostridia bacterium]|nr:phenylalanine--tRNA ligase subunit alpha [Clostridia bacterium]